MNMQIVDDKRRRYRLESSKQLDQSLIRAAEHVTQPDPAIAPQRFCREAFGAADRRPHRSGEFRDATLQIGRSDCVASAFERNLARARRSAKFRRPRT